MTRSFLSMRRFTEFSLIWWPICFLAAFNDFPLIENSNILRSPSFYSLILAVPCIIVSSLWRGLILNRVDRNVLIATSIISIYCFLTFASNYIFFDLYSGRELAALIGFSKGWFLLLFFLGMAWSYRVGFPDIDTEKFLSVLVKSGVLGFSFAFVMALIEFTAQLDISVVLKDLYFWSERIFHSRDNDYFGSFQVRSLSFEPSYLSLPLAFFLPLLLMRVSLKEGVLSYVLVLGLLVLAFLSGSRTALAVTLIQTVSYVALASHSLSTSKIVFRVILVFFSGFFLIYDRLMSIFSFAENEISNLERFGSWIAAVGVFFDNSSIGVGLNLAGGFLEQHYPSFFFLSYSSDAWLIDSNSFDGAVFALPPRILAELGAIGFSLCFIFVSAVIYRLWCLRGSAKETSDQFLFIASNGLLCLWLGLSLGSFGVDGLAFVGYWIMLGLSLCLIGLHKNCVQFSNSPKR